ncbi:MAG: hypothetical protein HYV97_07250 [Bdellovibrio sp.]|nr:hypothetical protein [Bdellovibrio sp.]
MKIKLAIAMTIAVLIVLSALFYFNLLPFGPIIFDRQAILIAQMVFTKDLGLRDERYEYKVIRADNYVEVKRTLVCPPEYACMGGGAKININKYTGILVDVQYTK